MTGLYDAVLGSDATVKGSAMGLIRRIRHGSASLVVNANNEVGLVLNLSEAHRVEGEIAGLAVCEVPRVGSVTVLPPGYRGHFTITGRCRVLQVRLPWAAVMARAAQMPDIAPEALAFRPQVNADDPTLARLIYVAAAGGERQDVAIGSIMSHLLARRAGQLLPAAAMRSGGIAPARLARVLDLIEAIPREDTTLQALASEAGMSLFHFAREFARATGLSPHQYVVRRRVNQAVILLDRRALSVGDVARRVGFSHATHLARHMRRLTGVTPDTLRHRVLP